MSGQGWKCCISQPGYAGDGCEWLYSPVMLYKAPCYKFPLISAGFQTSVAHNLTWCIHTPSSFIFETTILPVSGPLHPPTLELARYSQHQVKVIKNFTIDGFEGKEYV